MQGNYVAKPRQQYFVGGNPQQYVMAGLDGASQQQVFQPQQNVLALQGPQSSAPVCWRCGQPGHMQTHCKATVPKTG